MGSGTAKVSSESSADNNGDAGQNSEPQIINDDSENAAAVGHADHRTR
jgi:hypothetical protein